jgi:hypothetical protein
VARSQATANPAHALLRATAAFTNSELARLDRGEPIAKVLDTDRREVAIVGAVRIMGSQAQLFARYRSTSNEKTSDVVMETGKFSTTPVADDLRELTLKTTISRPFEPASPGTAACACRRATWNGSHAM